MKTTMNKPISNLQIKAVHATLGKIGINDSGERHEYLSQFTGHTINSVKDMSSQEANRILSVLKKEPVDPAKRIMSQEARNLVGEIYALSFKIPFLNKDYSELESPEDVEMNKAKISSWTKKYSKCRKPISRMTVDELYAVKIQMRDIITAIKRKGGVQ